MMHQPWILENGGKCNPLFQNYFSSVKQFVESEGCIPLESHVQELACFDHILVLKPLQHSHIPRDSFTDQSIKQALKEQLQLYIDSSIDFTNEEFLNLTVLLKKLANESASKVATDIMVLSNSLDYEKHYDLIGIAAL